MKYFFSGLIIIFFMGRLSAQTFFAEINPFPSQPNNISADDTIKILAIMVSFQDDRDGTTFGNGKFGSIYTQNYGNDILDPLPHDKTYFENHLLFVKNYFNKVSKGKLEIEYTVLPDTFSVSQPMRNYSPSPNSEDFKPIGDFAIEAWTIADQMYPGFQFSEYDIFLIFHAGVGRDVSLPGSIGNERDLPSVYLSDNAFKDIYGETFDGIPVSGGTFNITNSMIIPETESRELQTITGTFLFEITINGLICASIGSHLGLPDLFDTETGLSAIGRFGLMDGQGIFAYLGIYPPEPSPWSKIRLGWADPVTIDINGGDVNLVTNIAATMNDTVILKVPINSTEYFLIENRNRDANNDGSIVTYVVGGNIITRTFTKDTTGYYSFDVDSLAGVITDVDEFDWAVPGNGIVSWHIDENVISEKIAENKINTDKNRRGVDVEEADGIQDIGETFITIFGDEVIGEGTDEDLWYSSNPAELFTNRFAKDTRPNTLSNTGANSLITIKDFSDISNNMAFKVEVGDSVVKPLFINQLNISGIPTSLTVSQDLAEDLGFNTISHETLLYSTEQNYQEQFSIFSSYKVAATTSNTAEYIFGGIDASINLIIPANDSVYFESNDIGEMISSPLVINDDQILIGTEQGQILFYELSSNPSLIGTFTNFEPTSDINQIAGHGGFVAAIAESQILNSPQLLISYYFDTAGNSISFNDELLIRLALTKDGDGEYISIVLNNFNKFYIINTGLIISQFSIAASNPIETFALTDLNQDGSNYIVLNNGSNVEVYNLTGAMADNFPFTDPEGVGFVGTPLTADFEGDNRSEIISITEDGRIFAIDGATGKVVPGFPISCGGSVSVTPVLYNANGKTNLAVLNEQNILSAWSISSVEGKLYWSEEYGNSQNTSFIPAAENTNRFNEFFPTNRAYNYPNPVYDGTTQIRYYVSEDSKISIKIFDLAGDFVAEMNDDATGGMDNETTWNVNDIQSGVYFARIEANSTNGKTEQAVIKIAVVK